MMDLRLVVEVMMRMEDWMEDVRMSWLVAR